MWWSEELLNVTTVTILALIAAMANVNEEVQDVKVDPAMQKYWRIGSGPAESVRFICSGGRCVSLKFLG